MIRRTRPDKIYKNGRMYVPVDRNGYFSKAYMFRVISKGVKVNGVTYKVASCTIPAFGSRVFRYVCVSDLEKVAEAFSAKPPNQKMWVYQYIMKNASLFRSHHKTSAWLKRHLKSKFKVDIVHSVVQQAVRLARKHDDSLLIGERPVNLVYKILERNHDLRFEDGMKRKIMAMAEREYGMKANPRVVTDAVRRYDAKYGSLPSRVDKEKWATAKEASEFLGIGLKSMRALGREGLVERVVLLNRYVWYSWDSLRAYKAKRDAWVSKYNKSPFDGGKLLTEQEGVIE